MSLSPATTGLSQQLDQGSIKNFKTFYRLLVLKHLASTLNEVSDIANTVDLLYPIYFIQKTCESVCSTTIQNCFREGDEEDDLPLSVFTNISNLIRKQTGTSIISAYDFINIGGNLIVEHRFETEKTTNKNETISSDDETNMDHYY